MMSSNDLISYVCIFLLFLYLSSLLAGKYELWAYLILSYLILSNLVLSYKSYQSYLILILSNINLITLRHLPSPFIVGKYELWVVLWHNYHGGRNRKKVFFCDVKVTYQVKSTLIAHHFVGNFQQHPQMLLTVLFASQLPKINIQN